MEPWILLRWLRIITKSDGRQVNACVGAATAMCGATEYKYSTLRLRKMGEESHFKLQNHQLKMPWRQHSSSLSIYNILPGKKDKA